MKLVDLRFLLSKQFESGKFCKYDIIIRYMFIKAYYKNGEPENFKYKPYSRLALSRDTKDRSKKFVKLIKSFEKDGFGEEYPPIEFSQNHFICGATHRIALCLYFGISKIPYKYNEKCKRKKRRFNKIWLKDNGFSQYVNKIEKTKNEIFKKLGI
jgi:hypothetical protein